MIEKLKKRFKNIEEKEVWPYLKNVVNRLPDKERDELFKNEKFEIITFKKVPCVHVFFKKPIESLIYLDWAELCKKTELERNFGIAHEIAHHIGGGGTTHLWEWEAENKMREWGFEKEIEAADYLAPKFEKKGYDIGYGWAKKELSLSETQFFPILRMFICDWENEALTSEQENNLYSIINSTSMVDKFYEETDDNNIKDDDHNSLVKGVMCGIMYRVKELKEN